MEQLEGLSNSVKCPYEDTSVPLGREKKAITRKRAGPVWVSHCTFFSSDSSTFPSLQFFQTETMMNQNFDCGMATPSLT